MWRGLELAKELLVDFVRRGVRPEQARRKNRDRVDSGRRKEKITARPGLQGAYRHPVRWGMTAADVTAAGMAAYVESVRSWAEKTLEALVASGNLEA